MCDDYRVIELYRLRVPDRPYDFDQTLRIAGRYGGRYDSPRAGMLGGWIFTDRPSAERCLRHLRALDGIVLEPSSDGGYTVTVPNLPGCISEGHTEREARRNIAEAIELYLESPP